MIQDEAKSARDRLEGREGVCGFFDPTKDEFCPGRREGRKARFILIYCARLNTAP